MESDVQAFLDEYAPRVQMIAWEVRSLVLDVAPDALEQIDIPAKLLAYGYRQTYKDTICVIMPLKAAVNLGFPRGVELPDPTGLLTGTGKKARHVRLNTVEDTQAPGLRALLEAAVARLRSPNL
ncbi:MAG: hypothetical protein H6Q38_1249 [Chloroflexi bacterium]|nr:hypothetical protein [Chloroflexota bacterium]